MTCEEQKEKDQPTVNAWNETLREEIAAKERRAKGRLSKNDAASPEIVPLYSREYRPPKTG